MGLTSLAVQICKNINNQNSRYFPCHSSPCRQFSFSPPNNRRHEPHCSETMTTPPFQCNLSSISSIDASHHAHTSCHLEGFSSPIFCKCPFFCRGTCPTAASLRRKQSASLPHLTTYRSISIDDAPPKNPNTELPQRQPVDLTAIQAEIRANLEKLNRIFPPPMTTTMTPLPSRQPDPPLPPPTPISMTPIRPPKHEAVDLAAIQSEIRASMERLDRLFPLPMSTMTMLPLQPPEPPLPLPTPPEPTATEATPSLPLRSRIERLLSNLLLSNPVLWMPDTVYRRVTRNQLTELDLPCSSNPPSAPYTLHLGHPSDNNLPHNNYDSHYNPAYDIHLPLTDHHQQCHPHHFLLANHATRPYNPAFDIHLMMTDHCQHHHLHHSLCAHHTTRPYNPALDIHPTWLVHRLTPPQNHTCFTVASYVPGLAQNKRPP